MGMANGVYLRPQKELDKTRTCGVDFIGIISLDCDPMTI